MGRQELPQLIARKGQVDTDSQETSRASTCFYRTSLRKTCEKQSKTFRSTKL